MRRFSSKSAREILHGFIVVSIFFQRLHRRQRARLLHRLLPPSMLMAGRSILWRMANASIIVLCMRSSHDPAMNRSPCRCFSLRAGTGITSHSAHPRAPIGSHIQNVSVDPIQLSSGIVSPQKRIHNNALFQNGNQRLWPKLGQF